MSQPDTPKPRKSLLSALAFFGDRRALVMLALGFSAGLPYLLVFDTLSAWLRVANLSIEVIGYFSLATIASSLKFLWAPLIDRANIPVLAARLGHRRVRFRHRARRPGPPGQHPRHRRRPPGREQPVPAVDLEAGIAGFGNGRHIRQCRQAFRHIDAERLQFAAGNLPSELAEELLNRSINLNLGRTLMTSSRPPCTATA